MAKIKNLVQEGNKSRFFLVVRCNAFVEKIRYYREFVPKLSDYKENAGSLKSI
jgi:hypothetical protein